MGFCKIRAYITSGRRTTDLSQAFGSLECQLPCSHLRGGICSQPSELENILGHQVPVSPSLTSTELV